MKNYWTKSKVEKLSKLWGQGVSARDIASKLGDVSRNAVIGKANRLGLSKKLSSEKVTVKPKQEKIRKKKIEFTHEKYKELFSKKTSNR